MHSATSAAGARARARGGAGDWAVGAAVGVPGTAQAPEARGPSSKRLPTLTQLGDSISDQVTFFSLYKSFKEDTLHYYKQITVPVAISGKIDRCEPVENQCVTMEDNALVHWKSSQRADTDASLQQRWPAAGGRAGTAPGGPGPAPFSQERVVPHQQRAEGVQGPREPDPLQTASSQNPGTPKSDSNAPGPRSLPFTTPTWPPSTPWSGAQSSVAEQAPTVGTVRGRREDNCLPDVPTL